LSLVEVFIPHRPVFSHCFEFFTLAVVTMWSRRGCGVWFTAAEIATLILAVCSE
jgi:hypothetical protein